MRRAVSLGILSMAVICAANSRGRRTGPATFRASSPGRLEGEIQVDGSLNEAAWRTAPDIAASFRWSRDPARRPPKPRNVWIVYSRDALYIAVRCRDANPGRSLPPTCAGTRTWKRNDNVQLVLDTYNDHRNAYYFATNAAGALVDGRSPRTANRPPSGTASGSCERGSTKRLDCRIPDSLQDHRIRSAPRRVGIQHLPAHGSRERDVPVGFTLAGRRALPGGARGQPGRARRLSQGVGLDIKPYGITGVTRDITTSRQWDGTADAGGEIFYRITSNLISSTTINTDFAETEVDAGR